MVAQPSGGLGCGVSDLGIWSEYYPQADIAMINAIDQTDLKTKHESRTLCPFSFPLLRPKVLP